MKRLINFIRNIPTETLLLLTAITIFSVGQLLLAIALIGKWL